MLLAGLGHQVVRRPVIRRLGAEDDVAEPREEPAVPADGLVPQVEREFKCMDGRGRLGGEAPGPRVPGLPGPAFEAGRHVYGIGRRGLQRTGGLDIDGERLAAREVVLGLQPSRARLDEAPAGPEQLDGIAPFRLNPNGHGVGVHLLDLVGLRGRPELEIETRPQRHVPRIASRPRTAVRVRRALDQLDLLPQGTSCGELPEGEAKESHRLAVQPDHSKSLHATWRAYHAASLYANPSALNGSLLPN